MIVYLFSLWVFAVPSFAADNWSDFDSRVDRVMASITHESASARGSREAFVRLLRAEYDTPETEIRWALDRRMSFGEITAMAYIRATNGRVFADLSSDLATMSLSGYLENAGMSPEKMARSLEAFLKRAERERNSQIFDRLRTTRKVQSLPDLGSGFGLVQDTLDFRRVDSPSLTKIHPDLAGRGKGEK